MDNDRRLYSNSNLISNFLKGLTQIETLDGGWSAKYVDNKTGQQWLKYQVNSEYHGGGDYNLIRLPEPTTTELIEIALTSKYEDEIVAAALRLRDNEDYLDLEFRQPLIDKLERINLGDLSTQEKKRLINIIEYSTLNEEINRGEILNKKVSEIKTDSDFFKKIARQADTIMRQLCRT